MDSQIPEALFQSTLKCLVDVVNSETATLSSVAMQALGHIGLCAPRLGAPSVSSQNLLRSINECYINSNIN